jgi:hypothetical protein
MPVTPQLAIQPTFNIGNSVPMLSIADITDWASLHPGYTLIQGILSVVAPGNRRIYENIDYDNPDIYLPTLLKTGIPLPTDKNGLVIQGLYSIGYQALVNGIPYYNNFVFNYSYTQVTPDLTIIADGYLSTLTSNDNTNYAAYTIVSQNRVHTVTPPMGSPLVVKSEDSNIIVYPKNIWSGIWESNITNNVIYNHNSIIIDDIVNHTITQVVYSTDIETIRGWIDSYILVYRNTNNPKLISSMSRVLDIVNSDLDLYQIALVNSQLKDAYDYLTDITMLLNQPPTVEVINPYAPPTPEPTNFDPIEKICVQGNNDISLGLATKNGAVLMYTAHRDGRAGVDILRIPNDGISPYVSELGMITLPNSPSETCGITFSALIVGSNLTLRVNVDNSDSNNVTFRYFLFAM